MPQRENHILIEINNLDADVLALQEVRNPDFCEKLLKGSVFAYSAFEEQEERAAEIGSKKMSEGLAVFCRHPIKTVKFMEYALLVVVEQKGISQLFVNVHLPWDSVLAKEKCITDIMEEVHKIQADYYFILGDFNCNESSSVQRFLKGYRSLLNREVSPYWTDLALVAEEFLDVKREMTLDLKNNPRWKGNRITDNSDRVDTIFIRDCFPKAYPQLIDLKYFGKRVYEDTGFCASDHYGVLAELEF